MRHHTAIWTMIAGSALLLGGAVIIAVDVALGIQSPAAPVGAILCVTGFGLGLVSLFMRTR